jgi:hypothetical protein
VTKVHPTAVFEVVGELDRTPDAPRTMFTHEQRIGEDARAQV